jgi:hypothetical protein
MRKSRRVPGVVCGMHSFDSRYIEGRQWRHVWARPDEPLRFVCAGSSETLTPPDGFVHDYASIPRIAWALIGPPSGDGAGEAYGPPAILHDWAYERGAWDSGRPFPRWVADGIFWEACFDFDVRETVQELMYFCLRVGGWGHWRDHRKGRVKCAKYGNG